jgi:transcriptional regulator with XRE-family HTH domain
MTQPASHLGEEARRLRLRAGFTLRGFASQLDISAAHLSDIEHNRRRPSEKLLRKIAHELRSVGATLGSLERLATGIHPEAREWVTSTPGARAVLRRLVESGLDPADLLRALERTIARKKKSKSRRAM